ncbi:Acid phosphatase [Mycoplasmopsis meleagridis]|uniref:Acid phosphatase n=2 Tax=Mycoplasmopsis meleagridis TaxID=29561 RepID=A0A0F5H0G6_9BACT|nr:HAD family acid phosphatase [Mycoplasmopsis meleagridis]KKB26693.1 hypothetical protein MMELEA_00750 [Mycoplasmopsis meleagridis ATCC 25294]OAD18191.1 Acid phosphatase [Mycoplasmopsis meleagridis]VEU77748.1 Outer membrane protein P4 [Mycoplasmopsis meleagridis]
MNKYSKLLFVLGGLSSISLPMIAISCNKESSNINNDIKKDEEIAKLTQQLKDTQSKLNTAALASSNTWNSVSAEKQVMGRQVYKQATEAFDAIIKQPNVSLSSVKTTGDTITVTAPTNNQFIPVVFMDLDETVLNNFGYQNWLVANDKTFSSETWHDFVSQAISKEIPGAIDFIKHVWSKGGVVMFNSNRNQLTELEASKTNLTKLGLEAKYMPDWIWWMQGTDKATDQMPYNQTNRNVKVSKEERMHYINTHKLTINNVQAQFKVVMRIGDDISDFNDNFSKQNGITSQQVRDALSNKDNGYGILFGNTDLSNKSVYYNLSTNKWEKEDFAATYILIPGNTSYGSWVKQALGSSAFNVDKANNLLKATGWIYTPSK